jgi:hypothetical protein
MDDFSIPNGGNKIELDSWIIKGNLTCVEAENLLILNDISYKKESFPYSDSGVRLITDVGTIMHFDGDENSEITLHALLRQQGL